MDKFSIRYLSDTEVRFRVVLKKKNLNCLTRTLNPLFYFKVLIGRIKFFITFLRTGVVIVRVLLTPSHLNRGFI